MRFVSALLALALPVGLAWGADDLKPQQQRMRSCNTKADEKGLAAGERNHFMRACLKGANGDGHKLTSRQQRSQECSGEARAQKMQGAERRGFMSECESPPVKQRRADDARMKECERRADGRRLEGEDRSRYLDGCRSAVKAANAH